MTGHVDVSALLEPPSKEAVAALRVAAASRPDYARAAKAHPDVVGPIVGMLALFLMAGILVSGGRFGFHGASADGTVERILIVAASFAMTLVIIVWRVLGRRNDAWRRWTQLDALARANGMVFSPFGGAPDYPGAIFGVGEPREVLDHLTVVPSNSTERRLDYGTYRYTIGGGKNRSVKRWGYLALQLDRALPHMLLDARANNGLLGGTTLPTQFRRDQVLALEGDFNEHFTLYCPREYERDAYYVFTPDLMALLIDNAAPFDVEIIDRWMFVYSPEPFDLQSPTVHQRLRAIVDTVGAKTLSQTDRYVDERIGEFAPNLVAPQGQRLKRRFPIGVVIGVAVVVAYAVFWLIPTMMRF